MQRSSNSQFATRESPQYGVLSRDMSVSLGTAAGLFAITVAAMLVFADTIVGTGVLALYELSPIVGVIIVGAGLTIGRHLGMSGFLGDNTAQGFVGSVITILTYGAFGGAILTPYQPDLYVPAIVVASAITVAISLVAGAWVLNSNRSFEGWDKKAGGVFIVGVVAVLLGSFIPGTIGALALLLGFVLFIVGFTIDLVYEIWAMTSGRRNAMANGFGVYIAFTGIFVHILQIVLEAMAD